MADEYLAGLYDTLRKLRDEAIGVMRLINRRLMEAGERPPFLEADISGWERIAGSGSVATTTTKTVSGRSKTATESRSSKLPKRLPDAVRALMERHGEPMRPLAVWQTLKDEGYDYGDAKETSQKAYIRNILADVPYRKVGKGLYVYDASFEPGNLGGVQ